MSRKDFVEETFCGEFVRNAIPGKVDEIADPSS